MAHSDSTQTQSRRRQRWTIPRTCEQCRAAFEALPKRVNAGEARFCSRRCASNANKGAKRPGSGLSGVLNPAYKHGLSGQAVRYVKQWKAQNPEKFHVHRLVRKAVQKGLIVRPDQCQECGRLCKPDAHHDDYSRPYAIWWLCRRCHVQYNAPWGSCRAERKDGAGGRIRIDDLLITNQARYRHVTG
jgi:ferredoxin